jgi:hypothetical protein
LKLYLGETYILHPHQNVSQFFCPGAIGHLGLKPSGAHHRAIRAYLDMIILSLEN